MSDNEWKDHRIPKLFFRAPKPPTPFETDAFVSRVMGRIEEARRPAFSFVLDWLGGRWTVPALGLGIATMLLSTLYSPRSPLTLEASVAPDSAPAVWALPMEDAP